MRIRSIKPEFWSSESVGRLTIPARLVFIGLWNVADDEGRAVASLGALRGMLLPFNEDSLRIMEDSLNQLEREGMIVRYKHQGSSYLFIPKFLSHQRINRPTPSKLPAPGELFSEDSVSAHGGLTIGGEGKGREGKGGEVDESSPPSSALLQKPNSGCISTSMRIGLEREAREIKAWIKTRKQQDSYTPTEAEQWRQKKERLAKIEKALHIPLP